MISEQQVWNALPSHGFVRSYVEYASQCTDANIAYHVAGALSCLSQCVPENYAVPYASPIYGNIYSMIVGDSSKSRKTASINIAQRITAAAIPNSIGEMPGSQEGLYEGLRQQPKQLVVYGEWGEFLAKAEEGYMMALKTSFTNLWDCLPVGRALANKRQGAIQNPRLSLLCGVATDLLERHTEQADWTGGFLARFFTLFAEPEREFPTPPVDDPLARKNITDWLNQLANPAVPSGTCLWLDVPARKMWTDWYESMRPLRDGANRRAGAACSRSSAIAAKIALLLAWDIGDARSGYDWSVGIQELEPALKLTDLHLSSVLELGERVTGNKDMRDRAAVLRAIEEVPTPVGVILRGAEMLKRRAKEVLESLEEERSIERVTVGREVCYRRTPLAQAALVNMVEQQKAAAAAGSAQSVVGPAHNVLAFPAPPAPTTTHPAFANMPDVDLLPASELLNMLDPSELDEVDWSRYGG